jgi:hypothetical protein
MLATLIIELLIASALFLLVGWIHDVIRSGTHELSNCLNSEGTIGWEQMRRPRKPLMYDDAHATRTARTIRRHRPWDDRCGTLSRSGDFVRAELNSRRAMIQPREPAILDLGVISLHNAIRWIEMPTPAHLAPAA